MIKTTNLPDEWAAGGRFEQITIPVGNYYALVKDVDIVENRFGETAMEVLVDILVDDNNIVEYKVTGDLTGKMAWKSKNMLVALGNIDDSGKAKGPNTVSDFRYKSLRIP
jgi:hypothetical protein